MSVSERRDINSEIRHQESLASQDKFRQKTSPNIFKAQALTLTVQPQMQDEILK